MEFHWWLVPLFLGSLGLGCLVGKIIADKEDIHNCGLNTKEDMKRFLDEIRNKQ